VGHHGTVPKGLQEGELFTQVLKLRRTESEAPASEPTVLLWSSDSSGYINAFWFDESKLGEVCEILWSCEGLHSSDLLSLRAHEISSVGARNFLEGRMSLRELIRRRREI